METSSRAEGKRSLRDKAKKEVVVVEDGDDEEEEDDGLGLGFGDEEKKKRAVASGRKGSAGGGVSPPPCCQVEKCAADLTDAKRYHRRHKVCEQHSKASAVLIAGIRQRFCQQCSRFHELAEFDETKRSCRRRLAGHNERRRKTSSESQGDGSTQKGVSQSKENHCRQADERGRIQITIPGNSTYKHFQIR